MASRHPFLDGRAVTQIPVLVAPIFGVMYLFWYGSIDGDRCGVPLPELLGVGIVVLAAWMLSPRMATWEATAVPSVRRLAAAGMGFVLVVVAASPWVLFKAVTNLPPTLVPKHANYSFEGLGPGVWSPQVANLLVLGAIVFIGVALVGRLVGSIVAMVCYAALFWLGARFATPLPYTSACGWDTQDPAWVFAVPLAALALIVWTRTGGTTRWSRHLDPRH